MSIYPIRKDKAIWTAMRSAFLFLALIMTIALRQQFQGDTGDGIIVDIVWVAMLAIVLVLPVLYFKMRSAEPHFLIGETCFRIPRYYFWIREICNSKIFSIEELDVFGRYKILVVGLRDGESLWIESTKFQNFSHYKNFKECLERLAKENVISSGKSLFEVRDRSNHHLAIQLIFIAIWVFLLVFVSTRSVKNYELVLSLGALTKDVLEGRDLYRLSSWFFLHAGAIHLALNCLVYACVSEPLLRVVDCYRYLLLLYLSILGAALCTLVGSDHAYVVGASGGIFGLFGAFCAIKLGRQLPGSVSRSSDKYVYLTIILEIFGEYMADGIDSYAHLGGFASGFILTKTYLALSHKNSILQSTPVEKGLAIFLTFAYAAGLLRFLWLAAHA
ncbi:MAG: rhomboid family intramembrane serine protease [Pseudomonadales bacterium]|nr:rhomboid family intramembrane serine protease [Pseudomonadales bacterium]